MSLEKLAREWLGTHVADPSFDDEVASLAALLGRVREEALEEAAAKLDSMASHAPHQDYSYCCQDCRDEVLDLRAAKGGPDA